MRLWVEKATYECPQVGSRRYLFVLNNGSLPGYDCAHVKYSTSANLTRTGFGCSSRVGPWGLRLPLIRVFGDPSAFGTAFFVHMFHPDMCCYCSSARGLGVKFHAESEYFIYNFAAHLKFQLLSRSSLKRMAATFYG